MTEPLPSDPHDTTLLHCLCRSVLLHSLHMTVPSQRSPFHPLSLSIIYTPCSLCHPRLVIYFSCLNLFNLITPEAAVKRFISAAITFDCYVSFHSHTSFHTSILKLLPCITLPDSPVAILLWQCSFSDVLISVQLKETFL